MLCAVIIDVTVTSHEHHGVSDPRSFDCLLNVPRLTTSVHRYPNHRPLVRRIYQRPVGQENVSMSWRHPHLMKKGHLKSSRRIWENTNDELWLYIFHLSTLSMAPLIRGPMNARLVNYLLDSEKSAKLWKNWWKRFLWMPTIHSTRVYVVKNCKSVPFSDPW